MALVLNLVANGLTIPDIIREYPDLEPADIEQAFRYGAFLPNKRRFGAGKAVADRQPD